jgi:hypothetical protein
MLVDAFDRREIIITDIFDEGSKEE